MHARSLPTRPLLSAKSALNAVAVAFAVGGLGVAVSTLMEPGGLGGGDGQETAALTQGTPVYRPVTMTPAIMAATSPVVRTADERGEVAPSLTRSLQQELTRVGCYVGRIDGVWSVSTRAAMQRFTEALNARLTLDRPDPAMLALVQGRRGPACTTGCEPGSVAHRNGACMTTASIGALGSRGEVKREAGGALVAEPSEAFASETSAAEAAEPSASSELRSASAETYADNPQVLPLPPITVPNRAPAYAARSPVERGLANNNRDVISMAPTGRGEVAIGREDMGQGLASDRVGRGQEGQAAPEQYRRKRYSKDKALARAINKNFRSLKRAFKMIF